MKEEKNITTNRFVGFVDILGFKNLVDNNTHDEVLYLLNSLKKSLLDIDEKYVDRLKTWIFSDSILVVSKDDSYSSADAIMISISQIMEHSLQIGLLLKGVIAHGKFTADFKNSIFFGKPLIEAYLIEEEIKLSSIVLHHTFEKKVLSFEEEPKLFGGRRTVQFLTPLQHGSVNHLHLNWIEYFSLYKIKENEIKHTTVDNYVANLKKVYLTVSGHSRVYIDNTLKFIEECRNKSIIKK